MSCIPFFHDYSRWVDVAMSDRGAVLVQERRCKRCHKAQRRQTAWLGGDFDDLGDEIGQ